MDLVLRFGGESKFTVSVSTNKAPVSTWRAAVRYPEAPASPVTSEVGSLQDLPAAGEFRPGISADKGHIFNGFLFVCLFFQIWTSFDYRMKNLTHSLG